MVVGKECAGRRCICDVIFPKRKLNPLYFSPEIGCFWNILVLSGTKCGQEGRGMM